MNTCIVDNFLILGSDLAYTLTQYSSGLTSFLWLFTSCDLELRILLSLVSYMLIYFQPCFKTKNRQPNAEPAQRCCYYNLYNASLLKYKLCYFTSFKNFYVENVIGLRMLYKSCQNFLKQKVFCTSGIISNGKEKKNFLFLLELFLLNWI